MRGDFLMVSPVYSAFDGVHEYQVPIAIESGVGVDDWEIVDDREIVSRFQRAHARPHPQTETDACLFQ